MGIGRWFSSARGGLRRALGGRRVRLVLLAVSPLLIMLFAQRFAAWTDPLGNCAAPLDLSSEQRALCSMAGSEGGAREMAAQHYGDLSKDLNGLAIAIVVGVTILLRESMQTERPKRFALWSIVTVYLAMISIWSSIMFRFAIAEQLLEGMFSFDFIRDRFYLQTMTLALALSMLITIGASLYVIDPPARKDNAG